MYKLLKTSFIALTLTISATQANPHFPGLVSPSTPADIQENLPKDWPQEGIVVFPEAGRQVWLEAIQSAKSTLHIAAYKLSDPAIVDALCKAAKERNIKVDLLLEPFTYVHEKTQDIKAPVDRFKEANISVHFLSKRFNQAHYKTIVVDEKWGMVSTGNLDAESFDGIPESGEAPARDFAITVTQGDLVQQILKIFKADIEDQRVVATHPQIIVGPDEQRSTMLRLINAATSSITIYQQSIQDEGLTHALEGAAKAGIKVKILMMPFPFSKKEDQNKPHQDLVRQAKGHVYLNKKLYIHAKVVIIDEDLPDHRLMYIGSGNFYGPAVDRTRELGVLTEDPEQIAKVLSVFRNDMPQADPTSH